MIKVLPLRILAAPYITATFTEMEVECEYSYLFGLIKRKKVVGLSRICFASSQKDKFLWLEMYTGDEVTDYATLARLESLYKDFMIERGK